MSKEFEKEIKALEVVYSEIVEAIVNAPKREDYETSRVYFENAAARMNKWASLVNDVKVELESKKPLKDLSADNRPA